MNNKKVLLVGNSEVCICNFRKELVERLLDEDFDVIISSPYGSKFDKLISKGCVFEDTKMNRRSKDMLKDVTLFQKYIALIKKHRPDLVLTYTIKPNLYAGLAAMLMKVPYIMNITGLGTEIERGGLVGKMLIGFLKPLLLKSNCVFFQNIVHVDLFKKLGCIKENYRLVSGSGVNLKEHIPLAYPEETDIKLLYVGRLMPQKGIRELVEAAKIVAEQDSRIKVAALGFCEESFKPEFQKLNSDNVIKHMEYTADVDSVIAECSAVIMPSYHERMSNALLEGAACARPLLASDIPGCKEIIDNGKTGFIFNPRDASDMAEKMLKFAKLSRDERIRMGELGREKVKKEFDRDIVVDNVMKEIYRILEIEAEEKLNA